MTANEVNRLRQARVQLQIDQVQTATTDALVATVRCLAGPVRLGARFTFIDQHSTPINLTLNHIEVYNQTVEELHPVHTARVTLTGTGADLIQPGQTIEGTNPGL
jgi:hypothetical protein